MTNISSASKLDFFKVEKYEYTHDHICDFCNCPRPHFCMGLILEGKGIFKDCTETESISVLPGDIIFVPITSRYVSTWSGNPNITYISMHFIFDFPNAISRQKNYKLQKITIENFEQYKAYFQYALDHRYSEDESVQMAVLGKFYEVMSGILPNLVRKSSRPIDDRIEAAIEYIERNYQNDISIETLAQVSHMSMSHFFPIFKKALGMTPIEYIHYFRINRAVTLLMNDDNTPIEAIGEMLGFESSTYFRRTFKKITGKSPRDFRKCSMEL